MVSAKDWRFDDRFIFLKLFSIIGLRKFDLRIVGRISVSSWKKNLRVCYWKTICEIKTILELITIMFMD